MLTLKNIIEIFSKGRSPKGTEFEETWKSFWHKTEKPPIEQISGLNSALSNKAEIASLNKTNARVSQLDEEKASKEDLASVMGGLNPMGDALNIADLNTKPKRNKDSYFVLDQLDNNGDPYIFKYDEELADWINTKQVVYQNVAPKKNKDGELVVYEPDGIVNLQKYNLSSFGGGDWKTTANVRGADESYYSYDNYIIDEYIPTIGVRVKDDGKSIEVQGLLLIGRVIVDGDTFTLEKKLQIGFSSISNGRGEMFLFPDIELKDEYVGCNIFIRIHNRLMLFNNADTSKNVYTITSNGQIGEIAKNLNILYSFITIPKYNSIIPLQQSAKKLDEYDPSLHELRNFEVTTLLKDDFSTNQGWFPLDDYPINNYTIANDLLKLQFTANKHEALAMSDNNLIKQEEYHVELTIRSLTQNGGAIDIGSTFGANIGNGLNGYKTLFANEIGSEFRVVDFDITMIDVNFLFGTHQSRNKGDVFEVKNLVVYKVQSQMMKEVLALKARVGMTSILDLQETIYKNRIVELPTGLIEVPKTLIIPSNTRLIGVKGATNFQLVGDCENIFELDVNSQNITFDDIKCIGKTLITPTTTTVDDIKNKTGIGTDCGIDIVGYAKNIHIRGCEFTKFNLAGVNMLRTHSKYTRTVKLTDSVFGENYTGLLSDIRSEYHTAIGCTFAYNQIGAFIAGGNNFMSTCHFDANGVGLVVSGTLGENDSHGSVSAGSFNHNETFSIVAIDINNGFTFSGCHTWQGDIMLDNSVGFVFVGGEIACRILQKNIRTREEIQADDTKKAFVFTNMFHSNLFIKDYGGGQITDKAKLSLMGNRFIDGSDSSGINNMI